MRYMINGAKAVTQTLTKTRLRNQECVLEQLGQRVRISQSIKISCMPFRLANSAGMIYYVDLPV